MGTQVLCAFLALTLPARHAVAVIAAGQTIGNTVSVTAFLTVTNAASAVSPCAVSRES